MQEDHNEHPPLFRKWKHWYWLVLAALVAEIILFYLITTKTG